MKNLLFALGFFLLATATFAQTSLTTITVSTNADNGAGSLRAAITAGNSTSAPYTINITATGAIGLVSALPDITESCTILGQSALTPATGSGGTLIQRAATAEFRIFRMITPNKSLTLRDLILSNGRAMPENVSRGYDGLGGGGLVVSMGTGTLTMTRCLVANCKATFGPDAGGVQVLSGTAVITDCQFSDNETTAGEGGAFRCAGGAATFLRCTFAGNRSAFSGGAFVQANASTTMTNCTFSGNSSSEFGLGNAIHSGTASSLDLIHCSFVRNFGETFTLSAIGSIRLLNCLFDGNTSNRGTSNFQSTDGFTSLGGNISSSDADNTVLNQTTDKNNQNIGSGPLQRNNDGLVSTHTLGECSPARNAGISPAPLTLPPNDANSRSRSIPPNAGAFEYTGPPIALSLSALDDEVLTCANTSLTLTATATGSSSFQYRFTGTGQSNQPTSSSIISVSAAGTYTVTVTSAEGCQASATLTVTSNTATPGVSLTATNSGVITCAVRTLTLTAGSPTGGVTYSFASASSFTTTANRIAVNTTGTYSVTATNPVNGCLSSATTTITSSTGTPGVSLTATNNGVLLCGLQTLTLTAGSPTGGVSYSFAGTNSFTTQAANAIVVNSTGPYSVTAVNPATGCFSTTSLSVSSNLVPPAAVSISRTGAIGCGPNSVTLAATATGANSFSLLPGNQTTTTGQFVVTAIGTYTIVAANGAGTGCQSAGTNTILQGTNAAAGSITIDGQPGCNSPTRLTVPATGRSFVFTGPDGYVVSTVYRQTGTYSVFAGNVVLGGTYTLTVQSDEGCPALTSTVVVTGPVRCP